jgi:hypothetical protein
MSNEKKLPKAMYRGKLPIGNLELDCYVLDDETRILSSNSVFEAFGRNKRGLDTARNQDVLEALSKIMPNHGLAQTPAFLGSKSLISLVDIDFIAVLKPIEFLDGGNKIQGYKAELLPKLSWFMGKD